MTFVLIETIKERLDKQLPTLGKFRKTESEEEFTGILEYNQERSQYQLRSLQKENYDGLADMLIKWHGKSEPFDLIGKAYPFGNVYLEKCRYQAQSIKGNESMVTFHFENLYLSYQGKPFELTVFDQVQLAGHDLSHIWFNYSGFESNQEDSGRSLFKYMKKPIYDIYSSTSFSIYLNNLFSETKKHGSYLQKESRIIAFEFKEERTVSDIEEILDTLNRFLQFATGFFQPIQFVSLFYQDKYACSLINNDKVKSRKEIINSHEFLIYFDQESHPFQTLFDEWRKVEVEIQYALDKYLDAYEILKTDSLANARRALVELSTTFEIYGKYAEIISGRGNLHVAINSLAERISHERLKKIFIIDFGSYIARTRASLVHKVDDDEEFSEFILTGDGIKEFAVKLKVLFEITLLRDHFKYTEEEIYRQIKHPNPNMFFLDELV